MSFLHFGGLTSFEDSSFTARKVAYHELCIWTERDSRFSSNFDEKVRGYLLFLFEEHSIIALKEYVHTMSGRVLCRTAHWTVWGTAVDNHDGMLTEKRSLKVFACESRTCNTTHFNARVSFPFEPGAPWAVLPRPTITTLDSSSWTPWNAWRKLSFPFAGI